MLKTMKNVICRVKKIVTGRVITVLALCAALVCATLFLGVSINTVKISDGENIYTVRTIAGDINTALKSVDLRSQNYKIISSSVKDGIKNVEIAYTFPVYLTIGDETVKLEVTESTVGEIVKQAGYIIDDYDMIEPSPETLVTKTTYIDYSDVNYTYAVQQEAIPCGMDTVYSNQKMTGTKTTEAGTDGVKEVTYSYKYVNGVVVETTVTNTVTITEAVNGKTIIGTKKPAVTTSNNVNTISTLVPSSPIELDANGNPVNFKKHITVQATGYTYTGSNCSTGVAPQPGYIAVNPKYIPYGTKMYIKSSDGKYIYGYAVAADTGGFINSRPTNVDLFFTTKSACVNFGRRNVEIYILE